MPSAFSTSPLKAGSTSSAQPAEGLINHLQDSQEAHIRKIAGAVPDPELPILTLEELGVLRSVRIIGQRQVVVELTPTYTACPALETMASDVVKTLADHGWQATVNTVLTPAWSTDWISDDGRRKLRESGIAPPEPAQTQGPVFVELTVRCPRCDSSNTRLLSRFSSTACKSLRSCAACGEPFEHLKAL